MEPKFFFVFVTSLCPKINILYILRVLYLNNTLESVSVNSNGTVRVGYYCLFLARRLD